MFLVTINTFLPLTEPGLAMPTPPWRACITKLDAATGTGVPWHRNRWWRRHRLSRCTAGTVHEFFVSFVLLQLPCVRVLPAGSVRRSIGAPITVVLTKSFIGFVKRKSFANVSVERAIENFRPHRG
jgi:hypothetical protein